MRLGEAMIMEGLLDNVTLARALDRQLMFGGRLGTNLVEMGAIHEETLAKFLGKVLGLPYAGPEQFDNVPADVLEAVTAADVQKYLAFPIRRERSRLHVAMKDPNDSKAFDELQFILGLDIRPYISSEITILTALEKYYGVKRELRYIEAPEEVKKAAYEAAVLRFGTPGHDEGVKDAAGARPVLHPGPPPAGFLGALASPVDSEQIAGVVVSAASGHLLRAMLFKVNGKEVTCWKANGPGVDKGLMQGLRITLDTPSIFKDVVEDRHLYKGPVLPVPQNLSLLAALGGGSPLEAAVCPLVIKGRVRGVLYGDNGEGSMIGDGPLQTLRAIMAKASMSFEILLLKQKILAEG